MKVYIVDRYNKYMQQGNEKSIHWVRGNMYCIREVEMEWGLPVIENDRIDEPIAPEQFGIFEEYEEAVRYIKLMQHLNGGIR